MSRSNKVARVLTEGTLKAATTDIPYQAHWLGRFDAEGYLVALDIEHVMYDEKSFGPLAPPELEAIQARDHDLAWDKVHAEH